MDELTSSEDITNEQIGALDWDGLRALVQGKITLSPEQKEVVLHRARDIRQAEAEAEKRAYWSMDPDDREALDRAAALLTREEVAARRRKVDAWDLWGYEPILVRSRDTPRGQPGSGNGHWLAMTSDPYYVGTPTHWIQARWFMDLFPDLHFKHPVHIRAIHYALRIRTTVEFPVMNQQGKVIKWLSYSAELPKAWGFVQDAAWAARMLGLLDWDLIVDHKNPPPKRYVTPARRLAELTVRPLMVQDTDTVEALAPQLDLPELPTWPVMPYPPYLPELPELPAVEELPEARTSTADLPEPPARDDFPRYRLGAFDGAQRYDIVVCCEKSTMDDVLEPWCQRNNAELVTSEGEMTLTGKRDIVKRLIERGKPTVILTVTDFDFKGQQMPVSWMRTIQWCLDAAEWKDGLNPPEVVAFPATLTGEQVKRFNLPDEPISEKLKVIATGKSKGRDRAQWRKWKDKWGADQGSVELDAVEGSQEGRLGELLDEAVAAFYEDRARLATRTRDKRKEVVKKLDELRDAILEEHEDEITESHEGWEEATQEANDTLDAAWEAVREGLREPWEAAGKVLEEGTEHAQAYLKPAWKRAGKLVAQAAKIVKYAEAKAQEQLDAATARAHEAVDEPLEQARQQLDEAQEAATETLRVAWGTVREVVETVEHDLTERMPDVENDEEWAPPWSAEAPDDVLEKALFHSVRDYKEQVDRYQVFQGKIDDDEEDTEDSA